MKNLRSISAQEMIDKLGLAPLPFEGGFFRQTYKSKEPGISARLFGIDANSERKSSTAIYYLITSASFSALHRVKSDEIFHFYLGDPVEMIQISPDGRPSEHLLGSDIFGGQKPQTLVPKNHWQGLKLAKGGSWALLGTTVSPGYEDEDFELGSRRALVTQFPKLAAAIHDYTREEATP